jgi:hypothetical protein
MQSTAQRLIKQHLPMQEFPQSIPNLTEASNNLYELITGNNISLYADDGMRLAVSRAVAVEGPRGWKISKEKTSHKIDVVIALGMAALGAVEGGIARAPLNISQAFKAWAARPQLTNRLDGGPRYAPLPRPSAAEQQPAEPAAERIGVRSADSYQAFLAAARAAAKG